MEAEKKEINQQSNEIDMNIKYQKNNTLNELDKLAGIEHIYTADQLQYLHKTIPPFYRIPSINQIQELPNRSQVIRRYSQVSFINVFQFVKQDENGKLQLRQISDNEYNTLIVWFARFASLVCQISYNQDWYREQLINMLNAENIQKIQSSFSLLSELAYCILNIQNPMLVADVITLFKYCVEQECQTLISKGN